MFKLFIILIFIFLVTFSTDAYADEVNVIRVVDGDTLLVNNGEEHIYVRLACVDSPEVARTNKDKLTSEVGRRDQFLWGDISKAAVASIVGNKVDIHVTDIDRYNRLVADITLLNGKNLQEELLALGLTQIYPKYFSNCPNGVDKAMVQKEAHERKIGIWSDNIYIAPWIFRTQKNITHE